MIDFEDDTPTEADLAACYDGNYLNATAQGDRKTGPRSRGSTKKHCRSKVAGQKPSSSCPLPPSTRKWCSTLPTKTLLLMNSAATLPIGLVSRSDCSPSRPIWAASRRGACDCGCSRIRAVQLAQHQRQSHHPSRTCLGQTKQAIPVPTSTTPPIEQSLAGCPIYGAARYSHRTCRV